MSLRWAWLPPLVLVVMVLLVWTPLWTGEATLVVRDVGAYFYPLKGLLADAVKAGEWPWWNPWLRNGIPFYANPESGLFYPLSTLFFVAPLVPAYNWTLILHVSIAATGFYTWLRVEERSRPAAMFGAAAIVFGGVGMTLVNYLNVLQAFAWIGWTWWTWRCWLRDREIYWLALTALGFALQFLGGEPQVPVLTAGVALAMAYIAPLAESSTRGFRPAFGILTATIASMGLAMVQLVSTFELFMNSARRVGLSLEEALRWSLEPLQAVHLLLPAYFDGPGGSFDFLRLPTAEPPWLFALYLGVPTVALSFAAFRVESRRQDFLWAGVAITGFLLALGDNNPLIAAIELPSFVRVFRYPEKLLLLTAIAVPCLASSGLDAWLSGREKTRRRILGGCAIVVLSALTASFVIREGIVVDVIADRKSMLSTAMDPSWVLESVQRGMSHVLWVSGAVSVAVMTSFIVRRQIAVSLVGVIALADLLVANVGVAPVAPAEWIQADPIVLERLPVGDLRMEYRIRTSPVVGDPAHAFLAHEKTVYEQQGVLSMLMSPNRAMLQRVLAQDGTEAFRPIQDDWRSDILRQLPLRLRIRYLRLSSTAFFYEASGVMDETPGVREEPSPISGMSLYRIEDPLPRAYLVQHAVVEPDTVAAMNRLLSGGEDPGVVAYVDGGGGLAGPREPPAGRIEWLESGNHTVELAVQAPDSTFLVLTDTAYPGWRVTVDGKRASLRRANWHFKGVYLAPGEHVVRFHYRPRGIVAGSVVSLVSLLGLALAISMGGARRARRTRGDQELE